ncbi:MAG: thiamine pyrophosphate-dependent dehydrogenase E1 component subunit alpha [Thermoproteota archaeon]|jgi:Pyruvate/2-oxoglutarate dehydrogenase complex, dehydrogenase (E1) component, eukaryotic type, alpha subunit
MEIRKVQGASLSEIDTDPLKLLRKMVEIRKFEEKIEELFLVKGTLIGPAHLYLGQEAVAVGICSTLSKEDYVITSYRCHGHAIAKGVSLKKLMAEMFGKKTGTCKGLGGSMHAAISLEDGLVYATAIVGSQIPIAAGLALANKYLNKKIATVCFFGDGATNTGAFHEGINLASLWKLPVLYVCENNLYAEFTHITRSLSSRSVAERASSYNMKVIVVDGNDVVSVYKAAKEAVTEIRNLNGPIFIEARTYRMKGHGVYDQAKYRDPKEVEEWLKRDPIKIFKKRLIEEGIMDEKDYERIENEVTKEIEEAVNFAFESELLNFEELYKLVYVE